MNIELENLFLNACKNGLSIFTGAGFSLNSYDENSTPLPLGDELAKEISKEFNLSPNMPLANIATILESKNKDGLYKYLKQRFRVKTFAKEYKYLELVKLRNWFTTNIDNLPEMILAHSSSYYLNNMALHGPSFNDRSAIDFYTLHGSITNDYKPLVFNSLSIASSFSNSNKLWSDLIRATEKYPTLFWGYSLNDSGILQTLNSINLQGIEKKTKWIVLHKEMPDEQDYFKSLGFNIIIASNIDLLNYFANELATKTIEKNSYSTPTKVLFDQEYVPLSSVGLPVREINEFYLGAAPIWSDIYSGQLYRTSHFQLIQNFIFSKKNTIVLGTPASGKTTLLMQLAAFTNYEGHKLIIDYPTEEKSINIINRLNGQKAIIFIDNFTDDIFGFNYLNSNQNIRLVGFDREHNFEVVSHFIDRKDFNIHQVTTLTDNDIQEMYRRIPGSIKAKSLKKRITTTDEPPSLFEFVSLNLNYPKITQRYKSVIAQLESKDELLTDFLLLSSYVHQCRTPLSFDMAYSYFQDYIGSYHEIYELRDQLGELISEYVGDVVDDEQDYFIPRSVIVAETILDQVEGKYLRRMLHRFADNLPPYKINNYRIFSKRAHDKQIMVKAFPDWEEGKYYYERLLQDDPKNPYLLQQGALYLSYKSKFTDAFYWIDKARNLTNDRIFSVRNSHAIILFEANIKKEDSSIKETLDRSMGILKQCYIEDKRKMYHAKKFGEQAIEYFEKYGNQVGADYLRQASEWLDSEIKFNDWDRRLKDLKRRIDQKIKVF